MKLSALVLASLLVVSCAGSPSTTAPIPGPYEGLWGGTTEQAQGMSFVVSGTQIWNVGFEWRGICGNGGTGTGNSRIASGNITNDTFTASGGGTVLTWTLTGTFSSGTNASGTLGLTFNVPADGAAPGCTTSVQLPWTAVKGS